MNNSVTTTNNSRKRTRRKPGPPALRQAQGGEVAAATRTAGRPASPTISRVAEPSTPPASGVLVIDYPQENEVLRGPVYVVRLGASGEQPVELSIDKGSWQSCRLTSGYWWYDWNNILSGKHTLVARMRTPEGKFVKTPPRACIYLPN